MRSRTLTFVTATTLFTALALVLPLTQAQAQTLTVLHSFVGGTDGAFPSSRLVRDKAGNIYGTTENGGASDLGVVFKLDTTGTLTVLHSFTGPPDGAVPQAGMVLDKAGNLYGTTAVGNRGTVFKLDTSGKETVLYSFTWAGRVFPRCQFGPRQGGEHLRHNQRRRSCRPRSGFQAGYVR